MIKDAYKNLCEIEKKIEEKKLSEFEKKAVRQLLRTLKRTIGVELSILRSGYKTSIAGKLLKATGTDKKKIEKKIEELEKQLKEYEGLLQRLKGKERD